MKKMLTVIAILVAVFTVFGADDWKKFEALKTAEEFADYGTNQGGYIGLAVLCLVYADYLNNPEDFNSFNDYLTAFNAKAATAEGFESWGVYVLYARTLVGPMTDLQNYALDAYNYLMESDSSSIFLVGYYDNETFCIANNISSEDRFNAILKLMIKNNYSSDNSLTYLKTLNSLSQDLDEDDVVKGFKKLYRKFYPALTGNDDPNLAKVNYIASILKAYGYDVNK